MPVRERYAARAIAAALAFTLCYVGERTRVYWKEPIHSDTSTKSRVLLSNSAPPTFVYTDVAACQILFIPTWQRAAILLVSRYYGATQLCSWRQLAPASFLERTKCGARLSQLWCTLKSVSHAATQSGRYGGRLLVTSAKDARIWRLLERVTPGDGINLPRSASRRPLVRTAFTNI